MKAGFEEAAPILSNEYWTMEMVNRFDGEDRMRKLGIRSGVAFQLKNHACTYMQMKAQEARQKNAQ